MSSIDPRQRQVIELDEAGSYAEALALLQELYAETEAGPAPDSRRYFMTMFQWGLLAEKYPPAHAALAAARDEQVARLFGGEPYTGSEREAGGDAPWRRMSRYALIIDMNRMLGDPHATRALFLQLEAAQPELARRQAWHALPAIVEAGDFALADRYRGDPLERLNDINQSALGMLLFPPKGGAPRLAADLMNLTGDVRIGIDVLRGLGRPDEAAALREALLAGLGSEELRALAERELDEAGTIVREISEHRDRIDAA